MVVLTFIAINIVQPKGYAMEYKKTIAIDLDGVLDDYTGKYDENSILKIKPQNYTFSKTHFR